MAESLQEKKSKEEIEILNKAFQAFNEATQQLQDSYDRLQTRVKQLDLELAQKNEALEKNLKEKEEVKNYLNDILESLTSGVLVVDQSNVITTFNRTLGTILGLDPQTCLGRPLKSVFESDLLETLVARLAKNQGRPLSLNRELTLPGGGQIHARISASPVFDNTSGQIGTVLILQDLTRMKDLEEEAQRNQRLRATGEMAAGIAHEIRNPLGSIELFASLLARDLEADPDKAPLVEHIRSGVKTMDRIISSLLLFAKSPKPSRQKCDINRLLRELLEGSSGIAVPDNVKVTQHFGGGDLQVNGDRELLRQVLLNLLRNAIQAMPEGGELGLRTEKGTVSPTQENHREFITITVSDTGSGIPSDHLSNIFNPFFSTKDKGTGLGLSIAYNIIKAHQGTIDAESEESRGTRFTVNLPRWDDELDET